METLRQIITKINSAASTSDQSEASVSPALRRGLGLKQAEFITDASCRGGGVKSVSLRVYPTATGRVLSPPDLLHVGTRNHSLKDKLW